MADRACLKCVATNALSGPALHGHGRRTIATELTRPPAPVEDMRDVVRAFEKVYEHRRELASSAAGERRG
jgi:hypothetical protein